MINYNEIENYLEMLPQGANFRRTRLLAFLSAAIALDHFKITAAVLQYLKSDGVKRRAVYETVLQSYLFLGFPRMIEAAFAFDEIFGSHRKTSNSERPARYPIEKWLYDGRRLCREVYGKNYERLKDRITAVGPEIFDWMVLEGYGKVLSRPGLNRIERELAEVAALIIEQRERQLISHLLGSLNVGADIALLKQVNEDIAPLAGMRKYQKAAKIISRIEKRYAAQD